MRKISIITILICASLFSAKANKADLSNNDELTAITGKEAEVHELADRVYEIQALDKSTLSKTDRIALKSELISLKSKVAAWDNGGIYIGTGTLLVIIILLILLL